MLRLSLLLVLLAAVGAGPVCRSGRPGDARKRRLESASHRIWPVPDSIVAAIGAIAFKDKGNVAGVNTNCMVRPAPFGNLVINWFRNKACASYLRCLVECPQS